MLGQPREPNVDPLANLLLKGMFHLRFSDVCAELNEPYILFFLMITVLIVELYGKRSKHLIWLTFNLLTKLFMLVYVIQVDRAGKCERSITDSERRKSECNSTSERCTIAFVQ